MTYHWKPQKASRDGIPQRVKDVYGNPIAMRTAIGVEAENVYREKAGNGEFTVSCKGCGYHLCACLRTIRASSMYGAVDALMKRNQEAIFEMLRVPDKYLGTPSGVLAAAWSGSVIHHSKGPLNIAPVAQGVIDGEVKRTVHAGELLTVADFQTGWRIFEVIDGFRVRTAGNVDLGWFETRAEAEAYIGGKG